MSREIKFRIWSKKRKKWIDNSENPHDADYRSDWCAVEQFTGLKDKNGVDIYEGDVIQFSIPKNYSHQGLVVNTVVEFHKGMFVYNPYESKCIKEPDGWIEKNSFISSGWWKGGLYPLTKRWYGYGDLNYTEVVGNIHENKDLLDE